MIPTLGVVIVGDSTGLESPPRMKLDGMIAGWMVVSSRQEITTSLSTWSVLSACVCDKGHKSERQNGFSAAMEER